MGSICIINIYKTNNVLGTVVSVQLVFAGLITPREIVLLGVYFSISIHKCLGST